MYFSSFTFNEHPRYEENFPFSQNDHLQEGVDFVDSGRDLKNM